MDVLTASIVEPTAVEVSRIIFCADKRNVGVMLALFYDALYQAVVYFPGHHHKSSSRVDNRQHRIMLVRIKVKGVSIQESLANYAPETLSIQVVSCKRHFEQTSSSIHNLSLIYASEDDIRLIVFVKLALESGGVEGIAKEHNDPVN